MNRELTSSRRRARAIAISEASARATTLRTVLTIVAGLVALTEAALLAQRLLAAHG